ncbi:DNA-binding transcriptional regulator, ArsR family [Sphingomonas sp. NFR04]|uniref:ArsR/SmtB family transcription factor n=1 Tax=Sphingomonas sp. NFR04 TaxID=1566283 RepID=UPI0008F09DEE|nr:metalloregulator ArsR/SmtB family transcription factor [Sphingomonas sp. NFR04]SFK44235.1 DNA-binding transcriptional regulator, ArsR family [Sphingomonas sp. NFR04]
MTLENLHNRADEASVLLKLLSGHHRLTLLVALLDGETSVRRLAENVKKPETGVSQQLALLRSAGLVSKRRDGQRRLYSISNPAAEGLMQAALAMQFERTENEPMTLSD